MDVDVSYTCVLKVRWQFKVMSQFCSSNSIVTLTWGSLVPFTVLLMSCVISQLSCGPALNPHTWTDCWHGALDCWSHCKLLLFVYVVYFTNIHNLHQWLLQDDCSYHCPPGPTQLQGGKGEGWDSSRSPSAPSCWRSRLVLEQLHLLLSVHTVPPHLLEPRQQILSQKWMLIPEMKA